MASSLNGTGVAFSDGTSQASGSQSAKAWVNFNGSSGASPTIRTQYNVTSVVRNGTGDYTITFGTGVFADANYACGAMCSDSNNSVGISTVTTNTATLLRIGTQDGGNAPQDSAYVAVVAFR